MTNPLTQRVTRQRRVPLRQVENMVHNARTSRAYSSDDIRVDEDIIVNGDGGGRAGFTELQYNDNFYAPTRRPDGLGLEEHIIPPTLPPMELGLRHADLSAKLITIEGYKFWRTLDDRFQCATCLNVYGMNNRPMELGKVREWYIRKICSCTRQV